MTAETSTTNTDSQRVFAWLLFPLALFPLMALLTYDSSVYTQVPAAPSANWIGALGDAFAYYGYLFFGLAIWIVPIMCIIAGFCLARGRKMRAGRRILWFTLFLMSVSCILQAMGTNDCLVLQLTRRINIAAPGGVIGYLAMTKSLSPLLSNFGASIMMMVLALVALVAAIGLHNLINFFNWIFTWAMLGGGGAKIAAEERIARRQSPEESDETIVTPDPYEAIRVAKEEAKRQREEEKERLREAKIRAREEKRLAKESAKREKEEAKLAAKFSTESAFEGKVDSSASIPEDKGPYILPPISLLNPLKKSTADHGDVGEMSKKLVDTLKLFDVNATLAYTVQGPVVTKYALLPEPGTRPEKFIQLQQTLMMALKAKSLRIEAPIPGEDKIGIEVPNRSPAGITFREIFESNAWKNFKGELPLLFGKDAAGNELIADLASMPHMLVAGATGQGKSVCLNALINGLLMTKTPDQLKLIMVDPKSVEFSTYASLPHLNAPVITDNKKVVFSLRWAVAEMEKRLKLFARAKVRNIYDFNHRPSFTQTDMFGHDQQVGSEMPRTVPYIVIIIDEVADLMASSGKEVTPDISRLTAKARAAGIHLILATQRPDAKIINGTIKANIPGRVAFKTAQAIDSRTILDDSGAENLIGRGDMLFKGKDGNLVRAQGAWISDEEITRITNFIEQHSALQYDQRLTDKLETIKEDTIDLYGDNEASSNEATAKENAAAMKEQVRAEENASDFKKAIECIINTNRASTSHFQRKLGWGYNHSAKIMDMLEDAGVIGPQVGAGPRAIVMDQDQLMAILKGESSDEAAGDDSFDSPDGLQDDLPSADDEQL